MVRVIRALIVLCVVAATGCWSGAANAQRVSDSEAQAVLEFGRLMADRVYYYHDTWDDVFGPATPSYCEDLRAADQALSDLFDLSVRAAEAGQSDLVKEIDRVADSLVNELAAEEYYDYEYGQRQYCSPTMWGPPTASLFMPMVSLTALSSTTTGGGAVRPFGQIMFNIGLGLTALNAIAQTDFNTSGSGGADASQASFGFDPRIYFWLNPDFALTFGLWANWFAANQVVRALDVDNGTAGPDYYLRLQRQWYLMTYVGLTLALPTISAIRAGIAGQPNAGTFTTTFFTGVRRERLSGSILTDSAGNLAQTAIALAVTGWTFGINVDYPLWLTGTATALAYGFRPMIGFGVAVDTFPDFTVEHRGAFNQLFLTTVALDTVVRAYLRLGFQFQPGTT